jgi:uncharacterized membrane protein HdeD (DUF308 family)
MPGDIGQLAILLLGAFAAMLAITLASEPWKSPERTPILALFVAVAALFWSGANTFLQFFLAPRKSPSVFTISKTATSRD